MLGIQDKFIVRTFACGLVSVFVLMALTLFAAIFYFGDGEAYRIISDLTPPFLALAGAITAAFLGQHATTMWAARQQIQQMQSGVVQDSRYDARLAALAPPRVSLYPQGGTGPLGQRLAANSPHYAPDPGVDAGGAPEGEHANGH